MLQFDGHFHLKFLKDFHSKYLYKMYRKEFRQHAVNE